MSSEIVTYTGRVVDPLNLKPGQVNIVDIAHSLSNQCRFTGHVKTFYSVAQHSVLCAEFVRRVEGNDAHALALLLHDGSEADLSDLARPVKLAAGLGDIYRRIEDSIQAVVADTFGLQYPFPDIVHRVDNALLRREQECLMPRFRHIEVDLVYDKDIMGWLPSEAEQQFLNMFAELTGETPRR
jgi:hypothetical protein